MPLRHRKDAGPPGAAVGRRAAAYAVRPEEADWRVYDPIAEAYDRIHAPRTAVVARDLVALVGVGPGARVLDVGTGTGVVAQAAADQAGPDGVVAGIDASVPMLRAARRRSARVAAAEAIDLPFRDTTFDLVLSAFAIQHFASYDTALFDMLRVLRAGGRMAVAVWGPDDDEFTRTWRSIAEEFAEKEIMEDAYRRAVPGAERFSDAGRLKDVLHDAGLRDMVVDSREYRFDFAAEDYLVGREIATMGRFLRQMLGEELWESFRRRTREAFAEKFPPSFHDFRDVNLVVGIKP